MSEGVLKHDINRSSGFSSMNIAEGFAYAARARLVLSISPMNPVSPFFDLHQPECGRRGRAAQYASLDGQLAGLVPTDAPIVAILT